MTQTKLPFRGLASEGAATPSDPPSGLQALMGATLDEGKDVEYRALACRTAIGKCANPAMPFEHTVNPYRGCEFACRYCYARYTHEFLDLRDPLAFERLIYAKTGAPDAAARDLARHDFRGEAIAIGTATDPYQPAERKFLVTRGILEQIALRRGLDVSITTKSTLVLRDLDVIRKISLRSRITVNVSLITLDAALARKLEPRAPSPELRLKTLAKLRKAGVEAGLFAMPILPGLTDAPAALRELVRRAKGAGALWVKGGALFLPSAARRVFYPFLEKEFPGLLRRYHAVFDRALRNSDDYRARLRGFIHDLCLAEGIPVDLWPYGGSAAESSAVQRDLGFGAAASAAADDATARANSARA